MRAFSRILILTGALSALLFAALAVLSMGWIEPAGLTLFDRRLGGYSVAEARAFLEALSAEQTLIYLGMFRQLDTVFPLLLTFTLAGAIWNWTRNWHVMLRLAGVMAPVVYLAMDLLENMTVALMLHAGPVVSENVILQARCYTVAKWAILAVALLVVLFANRTTRRLNGTAA